jgi:hypothetical protein
VLEVRWIRFYEAVNEVYLLESVMHDLSVGAIGVVAGVLWAVLDLVLDYSVQDATDIPKPTIQRTRSRTDPQVALAEDEESLPAHRARILA